MLEIYISHRHGAKGCTRENKIVSGCGIAFLFFSCSDLAQTGCKIKHENKVASGCGSEFSVFDVLMLRIGLRMRL